MNHIFRYTYYDCGCPCLSPQSYDTHGQVSEKLLEMVHKMLHKNYAFDGTAVPEWDEYDEWEGYDDGGGC